jgi:hypothetical protein
MSESPMMASVCRPMTLRTTGEIGPSAKREDKFTPRGRRRTGEKGIGRISAHRLGGVLKLRSLKQRRRSPISLAKSRTSSRIDWNESVSLPRFTIHCVPALHFSSRSVYDRNKTLWCGYVTEFSEGLVYFAGDTAFGSPSDRFGKSSGRRISRCCRLERMNALVHVACAYDSRRGG